MASDTGQISPSSIEYYVRLLPHEIHTAVERLLVCETWAVALVCSFSPNGLYLHEIAAALGLSVDEARPKVERVVRSGTVARMVSDLARACDDTHVRYEATILTRRLVAALFDVAYAGRPPRFDPPA